MNSNFCGIFYNPLLDALFVNFMDDEKSEGIIRYHHRDPKLAYGTTQNNGVDKLIFINIYHFQSQYTGRLWTGNNSDNQHLVKFLQTWLKPYQINFANFNAQPQYLIGRITAIQKLPKTKNQLCSVTCGESKNWQIICGANNVAINSLVCVARHHTILNNGLVLQKKKINNVWSQEMICSAEELGLADHSEGILILTDDKFQNSVGASFWRKYYESDQ